MAIKTAVTTGVIVAMTIAGYSTVSAEEISLRCENLNYNPNCNLVESFHCYRYKNVRIKDDTVTVDTYGINEHQQAEYLDHRKDKRYDSEERVEVTKQTIKFGRYFGSHWVGEEIDRDTGMFGDYECTLQSTGPKF